MALNFGMNQLFKYSTDSNEGMRRIKDAGAFNSASVTVDGPVTTSSATFVDLTGVSVELATSGNPVLLLFFCEATNGNSGKGASFQIDRDGAAQSDTTQRIRALAIGSAYSNLCFFWVDDTVKGGTHTYKVQFKQVGGGIAGAQSNNLFAMELLGHKR